jgi:hypothetical protein
MNTTGQRTTSGIVSDPVPLLPRNPAPSNNNAGSADPAVAAVPSTVIAGSIWVDRIGSQEGYTTFTRRDTGQVYFTMHEESRFWSPTSHFYRGDVQQQQNPNIQPYCTMKVSYLLFRDTDNPIVPVKVKNKKFLRKSLWWFGQ